MKLSGIVRSASLAALLVSTLAQAAPKTYKGGRVQDVIVGSSSVSERSGRGAGGGFGLGIASYSSLGNVANLGLTSFPGISLALDLGSSGALQIVTGINSASPFTFGVGAEYKHLVSGSRAGGFHLGGGLALGTVSGGAAPNFFLNFNVLGGIQFVLPNVNNIQIDIDFGPQFGVNLASGAAVLGLGAFSAFSGMSIHYFF